MNEKDIIIKQTKALKDLTETVGELIRIVAVIKKQVDIHENALRGIGSLHKENKK